MADKNYYMTQQIGNSGVASTQNPYFLSENYSPYAISPRKRNVGEYFNSDSQYDEYLGDIEDAIQKGLTVDDLRAEKQDTLNMFANALLNNVVIAGTTAVAGVLGLADGIFEALAEGQVSKLWDNEVNNWAVDVQDATREAFPIYRGQQYEDSSIWSKLGTGIFWADLIQNLGFTEGMLVPGMGVSKLMQGAPKFARWLIPSLAASIGEGSVEAINARNDEVKNKTAIANQVYNEKAALTGSDLGLAALDSEYRETLKTIEDDANNAGNFVLGSNIALLTLTNAFEFGKLFSGGYGLSQYITRQGAKSVVDSKAKTVGMTVAKKLGDAGIEGIEEVSQKAITNTPSNYNDYNHFNESIFNPEKRELISNLWSAFGKTYAETMQDPATATEFASGFLIGALGVPTLRKATIPIKLENNIFGEVYSALKERGEASTLVDNINSRLQEDKKISALFNGLVRSATIKDDKERALEEQDIFNFKNAENAEIVSDVRMFEQAGLLDMYKEMIEGVSELSDGDIQGIVDSLKAEGKEATVDDVKDTVKKQQKKILDTIDSYQKFSKELIRSYPSLSDEALDNAIYLKHRLKDTNERIESIENKISNELYSVIGEELGIKVFGESSEEARELAKSGKQEIVERLRTDKEFSKKIQDALDKKYEGAEDISDLLDIINLLNDYNKLRESRIKLNTALSTTLLHPENAAEESQKMVDKINDAHNKAQKKKAREGYINRLNNTNDFDATYDIVDEILNDENFTEEDLSSIINETSNPVAKDLSKTLSLFDETNSAIDRANLPEEDANYLKSLLKKRLSEFPLFGDFSHPDLVTQGDTEVADPRDSMLNTFIGLGKSAMDAKVPIPESPKPDKKKPEVEDDKTGSDGVGTIPPISLEDKKGGTIFDEDKEDDKGKEKEKDKLDDKDKKDKVEDKKNILDGPFESFNDLLDVIEAALGKDEATELKNRKITVSTAYKKYKNTLSSTDTAEEAKIELQAAINYFLSKINSIEDFFEDRGVTFTLPFRDYIDKITSQAESLIKNDSQDTTLDNLNDELEKDKESVSDKEYYKSNVAEYEMDALKDGSFIDAEGKHKKHTSENPDVQAAINKIEFDYVNEGNIKPGDSIELRKEKIGDTEFIFMVHTKKGSDHIVGLMASNFKGKASVVAKLNNGAKVTVTVSKVMMGRRAYTRNKTRSLKDVAHLPERPLLGVVKNTSTGPGLITNASDITVEPVFDEPHSLGRVYILVPNSRGTLSAKRVRVKHFNESEFNLIALRETSNTRAKELHEIITAIANAKSDYDITKAFIRLGRVLHLTPDFHIRYRKYAGTHYLRLDGNGETMNISLRTEASQVIRITDDNTEVREDIEEKVTDVQDVYDSILEFLYKQNFSFNVQANKINRTSTYNNDLINDDILETNFVDLQEKDAWFTTSYFDDNGIERKPVNPKGTFNPRIPGQGIKFKVGKENYYIQDDNIYDSSGSLVENPSQLVKDLAWVAKNHGDAVNGVNLDNGRALLPDGRAINVKTQEYLSKAEIRQLQEDLNGRNDAVKAAKEALNKMYDSKLEPVSESKSDSKATISTPSGKIDKVITPIYSVFETVQKHKEILDRRTEEVLEQARQRGETIINPFDTPIYDNDQVFVGFYFIGINEINGEVTIYLLSEGNFTFSPTGKQLNLYETKGQKKKDIDTFNKINKALEETYGIKATKKIVVPFKLTSTGPRVEPLLNIEDTTESSKDTKLNKALEKLDKVLKDSESLVLTEDEQYYTRNGELYLRTTTATKAEQIVLEGEIFKGTSKNSLPSSTIGNHIHAFIEDFFMDKAGDPATYGERYKSASNEQYQTLAAQLQLIKEKLNFKIVKTEVLVSGELKVLDTETKTVGSVKVAGAIDILAIDENGDYHILDIKTKKTEYVEGKPTYTGHSQADINKWTKQLTAYKQYLESTYGIKVKTLTVLPVLVSYPNGNTHEYSVDKDGYLNVGNAKFSASKPLLLQPVSLDANRQLTLIYDKLEEKDKPLVKIKVEEKKEDKSDKKEKDDKPSGTSNLNDPVFNYKGKIDIPYKGTIEEGEILGVIEITGFGGKKLIKQIPMKPLHTEGNVTIYIGRDELFGDEDKQTKTKPVVGHAYYAILPNGDNSKVYDSLNQGTFTAEIFSEIVKHVKTYASQIIGTNQDTAIGKKVVLDTSKAEEEKKKKELEKALAEAEKTNKGGKPGTPGKPEPKAPTPTPPNSGKSDPTFAMLKKNKAAAATLKALGINNEAQWAVAPQQIKDTVLNCFNT